VRAVEPLTAIDTSQIYTRTTRANESLRGRVRIEHAIWRAIWRAIEGECRW
jgi:hypothetical protein